MSGHSGTQTRIACPVCGATIKFETTAPPDECHNCESIISSYLDAIQSRPANQRGATPRRKINFRKETRRVCLTTLAATAACSLVCVIAVFILVPIFDGDVRLWVYAAAYFGAMIGLIAGILWAVLDAVEERLLWGAIAGAATGTLAGAINFLVLRSTNYLPEVPFHEHFTVGLLAGAVAGLSMGAFRAEN